MNIQDNWRNLANAIIIQAVQDWRRAYKIHDYRIMKEIEVFLNSSYGEFLSGFPEGLLVEKLYKHPESPPNQHGGRRKKIYH